MAEVDRVGKLVNVGRPARGGHRHSKVIEHRAATDDRLSARAVGAATDPRPVDE